MIHNYSPLESQFCLFSIFSQLEEESFSQAFLRGMDQWIMEQRTRRKFQFSLQCSIEKHQVVCLFVCLGFWFCFPLNFLFACVFLFLNQQEDFRGFICTLILRNCNAGILLNTAGPLLQPALHFPWSLVPQSFQSPSLPTPLGLPCVPGGCKPQCGHQGYPLLEENPREGG